MWEGYQLYPYTPEATKNATPTPFGIVYPPDVRAPERRHARPDADGVLLVDGRRRLSATVRCLAGTVELPEPGEVAFELGGVRGRARLELDGDRMAL